MSFVKSETGAVTADMVGLLSATVILGIGAVTVVSAGVEHGAGVIRDCLLSLHAETPEGETPHHCTVSQTATATALKDEDPLPSLFLGFEDFMQAGEIVDYGRYHAILGGRYGDWFANTQQIHIKQDGFRGVYAHEGKTFMDLSSGGNHSLYRTIDDYDEGQPMKLSLWAADSENGLNEAEVYFGGELIGTINPLGLAMEPFEFEFEIGSGDLSNQIEIREVGGGAGQIGTYLDAIEINPV